MNQESFIEVGALMVPLMAFGALLKNALPKLNNNFIPLILAILGPLAFAAHKQSFDTNTLMQGFLGAIAAVGTHGAFRSTSAVVPRKKKKGNGTGGTIAAILLCFALLGGGCATRLAPEGVYKSDVILYNADQAIPLAYYTLHDFVTWEYENREVLKAVPEIGQAANHVRTNAESWLKAAEDAREKYRLTGGEDARSQLESALRALRVGMAKVVELRKETK